MEHNRDNGQVREPTISLDDMLRGLIWPLLLRGPAIALRPERWVLGVMAVVVIGLIGSVSGLWTGEDGVTFTEALADAVLEPVGAIVAGCLPWNWDQPGMIVGAVSDLFRAPVRLLDGHAISALVLGLPMLVVWCVAGLAISRSAACEVSLARVVPGPESLAFGLRRWLSGFAAMMLPLVFIGLIYLVIAIGGLMFRLPVLDVIASVLHGLGIVFAAGAVLVGVGIVLGWSLLVPALACEGTDALDAIQRVFAYVIGRPLRMIGYLIIAGAIGGVAFGVLSWIIALAVGLAEGAAGQWSGERGLSVLAGTAEGGTAAAAGTVIDFWESFLEVIIAGFIVSYVHTAGTLVYLLCRRVNDGQELAELWTEDGR